MHGRSSIPAAVLLLATVAVLPMLTAGQPWLRCDLSGSGRKYSAGSTYQDNLMHLLQVLRANSTSNSSSSSSPALFASGAFGAAPDAVYGLLLCRGDVSASDCTDCGTNALQDVRAACNRSRDVALLYNQCYVRLSDTDFLASTNNSGEARYISGSSINSSDVAGYSRAVTDLLGATVQYAVENSTRLFATGEWTGTDPGFLHIYSMAQCTPDLSPAQCRSCLEELVAQWWNVFHRNGTGARIIGTRCNLRSEHGRAAFYSGGAMVRLPIQAAEGSGTDVKVIIGGVIIGGAIVLVPVVWFIISWFMWKHAGISFVRRAGLEEFRRFEYHDLVEATGNFSKENLLGEGAFGVVHKGILKKKHDGTQEELAVKRIKESVLEVTNTFLGELKATSGTGHKNLVKLRGWCCSRIKWKLFDFIFCREHQSTDLFLVYELVTNGSLHDHIFCPGHTVLPWATRYEIAKGIASGLYYLHHQCKPYILHRDIKPANILLEADFSPKLADFGLSRIANQNNTIPLTEAIGTKAYMDPLCIKHGNVKFRRPSDVYSFGIVLLDIACTGKTTELVREIYRSQTSLEKFLEDAAGVELRGAFDRMQMKHVVILGLWCCFPDDAQRPSMEEAVKVLGSDAPLLNKGMQILKHGKNMINPDGHGQQLCLVN